MKGWPECVALLVDVVGSRAGRRAIVHAALLEAVGTINAAVPALDPLHPTVGDELQGVYATMGGAIAAAHRLRDETHGTLDVRCGLGGGQVTVIDEARGIQDGSAWWLAREAIDAVRDLATDPSHGSARTAVRDERTCAVATTDATTRLVDAHLARLRDGARRSLIGIRQGLDNAEVAAAESISPSANSQRVITNDLRPLAEAMAALAQLP